MNTNTRRSFIQTAIASVAAFLGFGAARLKKPDAKKGTVDFYIRLQRHDGYFSAILTSRNAGGYEEVGIAMTCAHESWNREVLCHDLVKAMNEKYAALVGVDPKEKKFILGDPWNGSDLPENFKPMTEEQFQSGADGPLWKPMVAVGEDGFLNACIPPITMCGPKGVPVPNRI